MKRAGAVALVGLLAAIGCFGGAAPAPPAPSRAAGELPPGWKVDAKTNDLVDTDTGYRFPVAVAGAVRGDAAAHFEAGAITLEYRGLRNGLDALLVLYAPLVTRGAPPVVAIDAMLREAKRDLPGVRVERVGPLAVPLGVRTAHGCQAELRQPADGGQAVWLYFALADRGGMIGLRTVYFDEPSGEAQEDAWRLSTALLGLLATPPERGAAVHAGAEASPPDSDPCSAVTAGP